MRTLKFDLSFNAVVITEFILFTFQFDEGKNKFDGAISADAVEKFVLANKLPLVIDFNQDVSCISFLHADKYDLSI